MRKIWDVTIGDNWSKHTVEARNYKEAAKKALRLSGATGINKTATCIELVREVED